MSRLSELLQTVKQLDHQLGEDLEAEVRPLQERLPFGLNFERHVPEAVELPGHKIRVGDKVRILPPRGSTAQEDPRLWRVTAIRDDQAVLTLFAGRASHETTVPLEDIVLVAEFRDPIFPGLRLDGVLERGGDKPFHTVINGENSHVLKQLTFTHSNSIDAIYIDPPYNSGAKDWKYNNNYVESDDLYMHSKWLAFMERRLRLAQLLLKKENSVLIVTIDEREYLRLGMLLEDIFDDARIQMVSSVINPKGASRSSAFGRVDEYIFFVMLGDAAPLPLPLGDEWKIVDDKRTRNLRWAELLRSGSGASRQHSPGNFYPVYICNTPEGPIFHSVGDTYLGTDRSEIAAPEGTVAIWPIRSDGTEGRWQVGPENLRRLIKLGYARIGRWRGSDTSLSYLNRGAWAKVEAGQFTITGRRADNSIIVDGSDYKPSYIPGTQWRIESHNAEQAGTNLVKAMLPGRRFPYPKSLYAVEDALRFFVMDKPEAIVLDFFAGSGTTAHAVMRLNHQDEGRRQSILVTNNEVSAADQIELRKQKLRPGETDWEQWGICEYITKPRISAAIIGETPEKQKIKGSYKYVDKFPISKGFQENVKFLTLSYESPWLVRTDRAFDAIAHLLWLRAGATGRCIEEIQNGWEIAETYGILSDLDLAYEFIDAVLSSENIRVVYVVTDDEGRYQQVSNELPGIETVRLYEAYLRNFESIGEFS